MAEGGQVRAKKYQHGKLFYLRLTKFGLGGNPPLRSVCVMTAQRTSASDREDSGFPRPRTGSYSTVISDGPVVSDDTVTSDRDLILDNINGVRSRLGESDPSRMLSGVLVLVIAVIIVTLTLVWWLV